MRSRRAAGRVCLRCGAQEFRWFLGLLAVAVAASVAVVVVHAGGARGAGDPRVWLRDGALAADVLGVVAVLGLPSALRAVRALRSGIVDVDDMAGAEFERRLAALFTALGYDVSHTGRRGDFGADLVVARSGERTVVQAKRYDGSVGIEAVQQVVGARSYYDAERAMVVTNSTCTSAARELARANAVELIERGALIGLLAAHPLGTHRPAALGVLARQVLSGAALVLYAVWCALRVVWWAVRLSHRVSSAAWRAIR